jgi:hypothetical protein
MTEKVEQTIKIAIWGVFLPKTKCFSHPCHTYLLLYPLGPPVIASKKNFPGSPDDGRRARADFIRGGCGASCPQARSGSSQTRPREATGTSSLRSIHWRRRRRRPPVRRRTGFATPRATSNTAHLCRCPPRPCSAFRGRCRPLAAGGGCMGSSP